MSEILFDLMTLTNTKVLTCILILKQSIFDSGVFYYSYDSIP